MFSFAEPGWLLLLLPIPASLFVYFIALRNKGGLPFAYKIWGGWGFSPQQLFVVVFLFASRVIYVLAFVILVGALSRPNVAYQKNVYLNSAAAILFLLDLSPSMGAVDVPPHSRIEQAKHAMRDFMANRSNDSIGIVGFGSEVALLWPASLNYQGAMKRFNDIRVASLGYGTAIGLGLAVSASHLIKLPNEHKILIVFTDGGNNTGEILPEGAADIIREQGIELYIVGLGQPDTRSALIFDPETGQQFHGNLSESYNPDRLRKIAAIAGGSFYNGASSQLLNKNIRTIDRKEESQSNTLIRVERRALEQYFIGAGLLLALLGFILRCVVFREQHI